MMTDSELVTRVLVEDDREAFECLVKKYQSSLRAFFRKMCGGDDGRADDLAQDTFLSAYRGLASFRGGSRFSTWLYAIAKNVFYQDLRRRDEFTELEENQSEAAVVSSDDARLDLAKWMLQLSVEERLVLTLTYVEELTQNEVAELLDIPLGTVKTRALVAKTKLRDLLSSTAKETR